MSRVYSNSTNTSHRPLTLWPRSLGLGPSHSSIIKSEKGQGQVTAATGACARIMHDDRDSRPRPRDTCREARLFSYFLYECRVLPYVVTSCSRLVFVSRLSVSVVFNLSTNMHASLRLQTPYSLNKNSLVSLGPWWLTTCTLLPVILDLEDGNTA